MLIAGIGAVVVAVASVGATWAAFSDFTILTGNRVGAGTVVLAEQNEDLVYDLPARGTSVTDTLRVRNDGTITADLALEIVSDGAAGDLCDGYDAGLHGGDLTLEIDGVALADADLCDNLDVRRVFATDVAGGDSVEVDITVDLSDDALFHWSERDDRYRLDLTARQSGGAGFSDFAEGTFAVTIGAFAPDVAIPGQCPQDIGSYRIYHDLGNHQDSLDLSEEVGPALVFAGNAKDGDIIGTPQDDCLLGENSKDIRLLGGPGNDVLLGGNGSDSLHGGLGNDRLYGGKGPDKLFGGSGDDHLDGGQSSQDECDGGHGDDTYERCETISDADQPAVTTASDEPSPTLLSVQSMEQDGSAPTDDPTTDERDRSSKPETASESDEEPSESESIDSASRSSGPESFESESEEGQNSSNDQGDESAKEPEPTASPSGTEPGDPEDS